MAASRVVGPKFAALQLSPGRLRLYAIALTAIGLGQIVHAPELSFFDWSGFRWAGLHVGTRALLHPSSVSDAFVYPPAVAWLIAPVAHLPVAASYAVHAALMLACAAACALAAAEVYPIRRTMAFALVFAWAPTMNAVVIGQNSPLGLLLVLLSLRGFLANRVIATAVPLGLLLYKPTYALPFLVVLALRLRWRELAIVAVIGTGLFVASAAAAQEWNWLPAWTQLEQRLYALDFARNAGKAVGVVGLLLRRGVPPVAVAIVALAVGTSATPLLRAEPRVAYAAAGLLMLNLSPHAWSYDAALVLPTIFLVVTRVTEPLRTALVATAYILAPTLIVASMIGLNVLALVVVGSLIALTLAEVAPSRVRPRPRRSVVS